MAPEQLDAPNRVDHRADIYSLGVVFYELLTGELPQGHFPVPSEKTPVSADIDNIVLKAMSKEREKRQQSAVEMKTEIETAGKTSVDLELQPETYPHELFDAQQRKKRITFWTWASIMMFILAGLCLEYGSSINYPIANGIVAIELGIAVATDEEIDTGEGFEEQMGARVEMIATAVGAFTLLFTFLCLAIYACCYFFYILRLWEEVPREFARTTPTMMACLSFIPIFHLYWMFVALPGLYRSMNKAMVSYRSNVRFGITWIVAACIFWLVVPLCWILYLILFAENISFSISITLFILDCAVTATMYRIIRNRVLEFIDIKSGVVCKHTEDTKRHPQF